MSADTSTDYARQEAFDPVRNPELFSGVRSRRIFAFLIDVIVIALLTLGAGVLVFVLGVFTLGLGFLLYAILPTAVALLYVAVTLAGPSPRRSACGPWAWRCAFGTVPGPIRCWPPFMPCCSGSRFPF